MSRILIVDDEPSIGWALQQALTDEGHVVNLVATAEDVWPHMDEETPDLVVMDVRLPGIDGLTTMQQLRQKIGDLPVVVMTAFGNLETAVQAIQSGAFEYLTKPFDLDDAVEVIRRALDSRSESSNASAQQIPSEAIGQTLVGQSPAMQTVFRKIALAAEHDVPVLITGESGTGKELVAMALHQHGRRSAGPFIPICVPAMSDALVESELFGHQAGSFTGAVTARTGLLEHAENGIAFFDEIGDVAPAIQVKLLRVLETKQVLRVGANRPVACNFRLIAATNRNLDAMMSANEFREDLFYRLDVFRIDLPPLRERREDIPLLAQHFLTQLPSASECFLSESTLAELLRRPWHGNVRELRNAIEHAAIQARLGRIEPHCLPPPAVHQRTNSSVTPAMSLSHAVEKWVQQQEDDGSNATPVLEAFLQEVEPVLIRHALSQSGGNRQEAARRLGIHRQTLREKSRRYLLEDNDESP